MIAYLQDVLVFARLIRDESNNIDDAPSVRPPVDNRRSPRPDCPVLRLPGVSHFDSEVMRPGLRDTDRCKLRPCERAAILQPFPRDPVHCSQQTA